MRINYEEVFWHASELAMAECEKLEDWSNKTFVEFKEKFIQQIVDQIQEGWDE